MRGASNLNERLKQIALAEHTERLSALCGALDVTADCESNQQRAAQIVGYLKSKGWKIERS